MQLSYIISYLWLIIIEDGAHIKMYTDIHKQIDCTVLIQDNMLVTSVYIYVHTDIRCCMSYNVYCKCHVLCKIIHVSYTQMLCVCMS